MATTRCSAAVSSRNTPSSRAERQLWEDLVRRPRRLGSCWTRTFLRRFNDAGPEGNADPVPRDPRKIVAGTGGRSHDLLGFATPNAKFGTGLRTAC